VSREGSRKVHFPVKLRRQRARGAGFFCVGFQPQGRAAPGRRCCEGAQVAPDQAVSGAHGCRCAVFNSGVGFSGVNEGCLPIIWCENDSQMLEGNLLNASKCDTQN